MPHFSKVFSRLAYARAQPMLRRYSGPLATGSEQSKNTTVSNKTKNQGDSTGNRGWIRDIPDTHTTETVKGRFMSEHNFVQVAKDIGMKWADLLANHTSRKIQDDIGRVEWRIRVLLAAIAGAGSSLLAWLVAEKLFKIMQENQTIKIREQRLYERLEKHVQETNKR